MSSLTLDQELNIKIFEFWKSTPIIKTIDHNDFKTIFNADARAQIIDILSQGVQDTNPSTNKVETRHALSAKEISNEIKKKYDVSLEKSNLYFHINHLVEAELIEIVAQIPSGKRIKTYYGRSSKICVTGGYEKKDHKIHDILDSDSLTELFTEINPQVNQKVIAQMREDLKTIQHWDYDIFEEWTKYAGSEIFDIDLDVRELTVFLSILYRFNTTVGIGLSKLAELLNFKMVGVHEIPPELIKKYSTKNYVAGELDEEKILNYWNEIPILNILNSTLSANLLDSSSKNKKGEKIRNAILEVLRKGIETVDSKGNKRFRYLYTAKEILHGVNEIFAKNMGDDSEKIKRASLYFHLDKLENATYIRVAGYVPKGTSQRISYYGRTGRVISISSFDEEYTTYPTIRSKGLRELIFRLNPEINKDDLEFLLQRIDFINKYSFATFPIWVERNEKALENVNIDLVKLSLIINILRRFNPDVIAGLKELSDLLQFQQAA